MPNVWASRGLNDQQIWLAMLQGDHYLPYAAYLLIIHVFLMLVFPVVQWDNHFSEPFPTIFLIY
jgi:hypothetical protein